MFHLKEDCKRLEAVLGVYSCTVKREGSTWVKYSQVSVFLII